MVDTYTHLSAHALQLMTNPKAAALLNKEYNYVLEGPIDIIIDDESQQVSFSAAGLQLSQIMHYPQGPAPGLAGHTESRFHR